jgi:hypothetical protein
MENESTVTSLCSGRTTLKKRCVDKLVLGCFFCLAFAESAGHVPRSAGKCGEVKKSAGKEITMIKKWFAFLV